MRPNRLHVAASLALVAFYFRAAPLLQNRFHPDEALYATFARLIASGRDPLLSTIVVDKPPLPFYLMAVSLSVFGGTELAARLPTLFASLLTIPILYQLGRSLYNTSTGLFAALLLAASPMAILFAVTLFTDTLLAAFLLLCLLFITRRRWFYAGLAFGLAFACKQTALFFVPLILILAIIQFALTPSLPRSRTSILRAILDFALPCLLCTIAIFVWDSVRHAPISFWTQGYSDNNPGRLVRSNEIWPRWWAWLDLLQYLIGSPILSILFILVLPILLILHPRTLAALYDHLLTGFVLTFLAGYWLLAFNVWDRYLVILTPVIALLTGRILSVLENKLRPPLHSALPALLLTILCLLSPAFTASQSGYPIGGDHGAYDGIDKIATALKTVPPGSVLYDHWLSWELGFYLFDGPVYIAWMPGPGQLADDLRAFGNKSPRYIVSPSWESFTEMQTAIEDAGFKTEVLQQTYRRDGSLSFTLYQIRSNQP
jgi:4-amino-4-deoxy-L-arabinose transferase-like glycosyltransferase